MHKNIIKLKRYQHFSFLKKSGQKSNIHLYFEKSAVEYKTGHSLYCLQTDFISYQYPIYTSVFSKIKK